MAARSVAEAAADEDDEDQKKDRRGAGTARGAVLRGVMRGLHARAAERNMMRRKERSCGSRGQEQTVGGGDGDGGERMARAAVLC